MGITGQDYGFLSLDQVKQAVVLDRMKKLDNNQTHAASSLGITRNTLAKLLAQFAKNDEATQKRINDNVALLSKMNNRIDEFDLDNATGMSVPRPAAPLKIPVLLKARPEEGGAIAKVVTAEEAKIKKNTVLLGNLKPSPAVEVNDPLLTEAQQEHARFDKLDKTLYSVKNPIGEKDKPKAKGKKKKAKKAKATAGKK